MVFLPDARFLRWISLSLYILMYKKQTYTIRHDSKQVKDMINGSILLPYLNS